MSIQINRKPLKAKELNAIGGILPPRERKSLLPFEIETEIQIDYHDGLNYKLQNTVHCKLIFWLSEAKEIFASKNNYWEK